MTPEDSKANQILDLLNQFDGDLSKKEAYVKKLESLLDERSATMLLACLLLAGFSHLLNKGELFKNTDTTSGKEMEQ